MDRISSYMAGFNAPIAGRFYAPHDSSVTCLSLRDTGKNNTEVPC